VPELFSVIVVTYNREDALDAVLRSLAAQTDRHFEVIVADDGSRISTQQLVNSWIPRIGVPLLHVRQEHDGFRAAEIRNRAVLRSRGLVCVFIDGDCIVRPDFVSVHRELAEAGWFVAGNRVLLNRRITQRILAAGLRPELWPPWRWLLAWLTGEANRVLPLIPLSIGPLRKLRPRTWTGARSANLAVRREDLLRVDGFDAVYRGWGREDSDLIIRLLRSGVCRKDGWFATGTLHLWHPENDRSRMPDNERLLAEVIAQDRVHASWGLSKLKQEPQGRPRFQPMRPSIP
jgi:glycosyltransferase involved in cell wall biosynthesis